MSIVPPPANVPEYSVSELSRQLKRTLEDAFGLVRVRGEVSKVSVAGSGHAYFDLKDESSVLSSVIWKGALARLKVRPEQGLEVIVTGRLSTFPGQSRYQLIVESLEPAGLGALMVQLERRRQALSAEGLFDAARKKTLPFLPRVIGVVTSPTGAVIRDILHRLRDRFPCHVIVWPTLVQGDRAAAQIAAAIAGFNALKPGGAVMRPDLLIVARGGGSIEDLWCFNDEMVVRAAAASAIPLISAVGHETDTTLIDFAADVRAPTPTAAAEIAVPVRLQLLATLEERISAQLRRAIAARSDAAAQALLSAGRGLGRPEAVLTPAEQRFDRLADRLDPALRLRVSERAAALARVAGGFRPALLRAAVRAHGQQLASSVQRLQRAADRRFASLAERQARAQLPRVALPARLQALETSTARAGGQLTMAVQRALAEATNRLSSRTRLLETLSYRGVLARGFVLVMDGAGAVIRRAADTQPGADVRLLFDDAPLAARIEGPVSPAPEPGPGAARPRRRAADRKPPPQSTLF